MPQLERSSEPSPVPNAIGSMPATDAMLVMTIGRNFDCVAQKHRLMRRNTRTDQRGALVHNQNCVVYHDPDHHHTAEEPHHGHRHAGCPERRIHAEEAERHREHDQEGTGQDSMIAAIRR